MAGSPQLYRGFMVECGKGLAFGFVAASAYYLAVSKQDEGRIKAYYKKRAEDEAAAKK